MIYGTDFNAVDIGAIVLVLLELLLGLRRGLAGTLFRLMSTLVILLVGLRLYQPFGRLLFQHTTLLAENPETTSALAFLLIILVLGVWFLVLRWLLRVLMTVIFNERINSVGGGLAGVFHGLTLVFLIVYAAGLWPQAGMRRQFVQTSLVGRTVFWISPRVIAVVEQVGFRQLPPLLPPDQPHKPDKP